MIRGVLRRAAGSWLFIAFLAMLFVAGWAGSTWAYFDGATQQTATYSGGYVEAPTNQTATASGYDGVVTWTPPALVTTTITTPTTTYSTTTRPGVQGQRILMKDNATSTDCSSVTYTSTLATGLAPTVSTYTDSNRTASSGAGDQYCYAVESYYTTNSWYQTARAGATQLGLVVDSVVITPGPNTPGHLDTGDTIAFTFNQPPATPANGTICTFHTGGIIFIGDSACSSTSDAYVIAKLSGFTVGGVGHQKRTGTVSISGNVLTVTVGANGQTVSGSGTITLSTSLKSAATTDQATVCPASQSQCNPPISGNF